MCGAMTVADAGGGDNAGGTLDAVAPGGSGDGGGAVADAAADLIADAPLAWDQSRIANTSSDWWLNALKGEYYFSFDISGASNQSDCAMFTDVITFSNAVLAKYASGVLPAKMVPGSGEVSGWTYDPGQVKTATGPGTATELNGATDLIDGGAAPFFTPNYSATGFAWENYINGNYKLELQVWQMASVANATQLYTDLLTDGSVYSTVTFAAVPAICPSIVTGTGGVTSPGGSTATGGSTGGTTSAGGVASSGGTTSPTGGSSAGGATACNLSSGVVVGCQVAPNPPILAVTDTCSIGLWADDTASSGGFPAPWCTATDGTSSCTLTLACSGAANSLHVTGTYSGSGDGNAGFGTVLQVMSDAGVGCPKMDITGFTGVTLDINATTVPSNTLYFGLSLGDGNAASKTITTTPGTPQSLNIPFGTLTKANACGSVTGPGVDAIYILFAWFNDNASHAVDVTFSNIGFY
jgi:hypothetical protein